MTLDPGDVCVFSLRAKCGIPQLQFETDTYGDDIDIYTIDYDD
jgi:hypothetical protein